jgi:PAS domain S-box-containing protein/putative nucleotidyltransferase with HDIG domain
MNNETEKKIKQAHQEWMAALDVLEDPIFMHDKDFRILRCNQAYQQCAGLPFNQIIGRPYFDIFPKTHAPLRHCLKALDQSAAEGDEEEVLVGDILFRSRSYAIRNEEGAYLYSVHTLEDITERQRGRQALHESESRYRRLFEAAKDGILILDGETGEITDANPFILDLLSYRLDECIGKKLWEIGLFSDIEESKAAFGELQAKGYIRYEDLPLQTKDERRINVEFVSNRYEVDGRKVFQCNIRDITARKRMEEMIIASHDLLQSVVENTPIRIFWKDTELRYLGCNTVFAHDAGLSRPEELIGKDDFQMGWRDQAELYRADDRRIIDSGIPKIGYEEPQTTPDGRRIWLSTSKVPLRAADGTVIGILGIYDDITERKQAESLLRQERDFSDSLVETAQVIILLLNPKGQIVRFNRYMETLTGYSLNEVEGQDWFSTFLPEPERKKTRRLFFKAINNIQTQGNVSPILTKDGRQRQIEWYDKTQKDAEGQTTGLLAVGIDVTDRKQVEERLKLFRVLLDHSGDAIEVLEPLTLRFLDINKTECRILGYSREELLSMSVYDIDPEFNKDLARAAEERMRQSGSISFEGLHRRKDGSTFPVEVSTTLVELDKPYILSIARDISERKQAEAALSRSNRALRTLSAANLALVRATSEDELLQEVTGVIVEKGGYSLAMVCYAEEDPEKNIIPMAWSGTEGSYFWEGHPSWADTEEGQLPVALAIRSGRTQLRHNIAEESKLQDWRDAALSRGYLSNIALPLSGGGRVFGALSIYSSGVEPFDEDEVRLLEELANDLAYGINSLRTRIEHEQHAALLRQSLEQSIQTIAATLEARDPYTAGHQRRVGELATALARELGLPENQVQGIHFASLIHDIGKIHVPAEILSKPGKLSELEYKLIQIHPQAGYEILKDVKFPWPIAEIIHQHHERLDGSGYPQGLKENQILIESKIIAVADVVEAMASHRPYRPARGIKSALDEIRRGRGSVYDPSVADACLNLFAGNKFTFSREPS